MVLANAHFAHELATECVDDAGDGGRLALADEVEVEHALHGAGLQAAVGAVRACPALYSTSGGQILLDEASCLGVEERVGGGGAQWPTGSCETTNVVICRETVLGGRRNLRGGPVGLHGGRHGGRELAVSKRTAVRRVLYGTGDVSLNCSEWQNGRSCVSGEEALADVRGPQG